jgi:hypothetical protein
MSHDGCFGKIILLFTPLLTKRPNKKQNKTKKQSSNQQLFFGAANVRRFGQNKITAPL